MSLVAMRLTPWRAATVGANMRVADRVDCAAYDYDPHDALRHGMEVGTAYAAVDKDTEETIGAFGWSASEGTIWSLWTNSLTRGHVKDIMRYTVPLVRQAVIKTGALLGNYVWTENHVTLRWLKASHCFVVDEGRRHSYKGHDYFLFMVKPLENLPHA